MRTHDEIMYALWKSKKYRWTLKEIAELIGCDVATVRRHIDKERWKKWEIVITAKQLREVYSREGTIRKTADALMCSVGTVYKNLKKYNIKRNDPGRRRLNSNVHEKKKCEH